MEELRAFGRVQSAQELGLERVDRSLPGRALDWQVHASHGQDAQKIPRLVNMNSDPSLEVRDSRTVMHLCLSSCRAAWFTICHWVKRLLLRCSSR